MAAADSFDTQNAAPEGTMLFNGLLGVSGTAGVETALVAQDGAQEELVDGDQENREFCQHVRAWLVKLLLQFTGHFIKQRVAHLPDFLFAELVQLRARQHYHVDCTKLRFSGPKRFTKNPFYTVSLYGKTGIFFGYHQTHSGTGVFCVFDEEQNMAVGYSQIRALEYR
jgi:hypothetical protein